MERDKVNLILALYLPVIIAYGLSNSPVISYFVAWGGSLFIFYLSTLSPLAYYDRSMPIYRQVMRPIFLTQFIFAGFMCVTSIFFFLDHLGYRYLTELNFGAHFRENDYTSLIATCQRLSLLGHAALVTGMVVAMKAQPIHPKYIQSSDSNNFLIWLGIIVFLIGSLGQLIPGLGQIAGPLLLIGVACAAVLFSKGVIEKNMLYLGIGGGIIIANFAQASLSGFKEPIITNVIILACVFLPYFKKTIMFSALPVGYLLLYFLPTYAMNVRQSWKGDLSAEDAQGQAFDSFNDASNKEKIDDTNWEFLTNRISEINMFTIYVDFVPEHHDYYGWSIVENSLIALIPRIFWPEKPITENVAMERVYDAGVISTLSDASAKTRPIVDAYISWGILGVFFFMLLYGLLVQYLCNTAEELFGGYELGCIIIFNSIFQPLWRGNNFEFMFNNVFYEVLIMVALFYLLKTIKSLQPVYN